MACVDGPEHQHGAGTRIQPAAEQRGKLRDHAGQSVHNIGGDLWPGGMPTRAMHMHMNNIRSRRDRSSAQPNLANPKLRLRVQGKNAAHIIQSAPGDHIRRATLHDFLRRLENETKPNGERIRIQRTRQRQHNRGMHIVPAGVHHPRGGGAKSHGCGFFDGQRIQVSTKRNARTDTRANIHHQPCGGKQGWSHPVLAEHSRNELGGAALLVRKLRVSMKMPPPTNHCLAMRGKPFVNVLADTH